MKVRFEDFHTITRAHTRPDPTNVTQEIWEVAAVFERAGLMVSLESSGQLGDCREDFPDAPSWRQLVRAACRETGIFDDLPQVDDDNSDDWDLLLECLEGRVLWDRDWELNEHLDADPEAGGPAKRVLGIDRDYFVDVPPEPSDCSPKCDRSHGAPRSPRRKNDKGPQRPEEQAPMLRGYATGSVGEWLREPTHPGRLPWDRPAQASRAMRSSARSSHSAAAQADPPGRIECVPTDAKRVADAAQSRDNRGQPIARIEE